jgi:hypothetical protein
VIQKEVTALAFRQIGPYMSSIVLVAGAQAAAGTAEAFLRADGCRDHFGNHWAAAAGVYAPHRPSIMPATRLQRRVRRFGICAWKWGPIVVFYLLADMALLSILTVLTIEADAIDYDRVRGRHDGPSISHEKTSGLGVLVSSRHACARHRRRALTQGAPARCLLRLGHP